VAVLDPYGADLQISDAGDLVVTPTGDLALISGPLNCGQALTLRLRTAAGELPLHPDYGSDLDRRLIASRTSDDELALTSARVLLSKIVRADSRFLAVRDLSTTRLNASGTQLAIACKLALAARDSIAVTSLAAPRGDEISVTTDLPSLDELTTTAVSDLAFLTDTDLDLDELPDLDAFITGEAQPD
jgi:hypothetical protein